MTDKYIAIKDVPSGFVHFRHPWIAKGSICELVFCSETYIIVYKSYKICCIGSKMEREYFRKITL